MAEVRHGIIHVVYYSTLYIKFSTGKANLRFSSGKRNKIVVICGWGKNLVIGVEESW